MKGQQNKRGKQLARKIMSIVLGITPVSFHKIHQTNEDSAKVMQEKVVVLK